DGGAVGLRGSDGGAGQAWLDGRQCGGHWCGVLRVLSVEDEGCGEIYGIARIKISGGIVGGGWHGGSLPLRVPCCGCVLPFVLSVAVVLSVAAVRRVCGSTASRCRRVASLGGRGGDRIC